MSTLTIVLTLTCLWVGVWFLGQVVLALVAAAISEQYRSDPFWVSFRKHLFS